MNHDPEIVPGSVVVTSTPLVASDTYGVGETIAVSVTFDAPVVVDASNGTPYLIIKLNDPSNPMLVRHAEYVRGTGTSTLEFEYIAQTDDADNNGLGLRSGSLVLNGGTIQHAHSGRDANLSYDEVGDAGKNPSHKVDGSRSAPLTELSSLAFSGGTLSPAFDPATTDYTAWFPPTATVTTLTATALIGHIGAIVPADSDTETPGHQVSLEGDPEVVTITVMRAGRLTVTYRVRIAEIVSTSRPDAPTNLMATGGDEAVSLAWDAPEEDADILRHEYRHKPASDAAYPDTWTAIAGSAPGGANEDGYAVTGLTNGTVYEFQIRAVNGLGGSEPSNEASIMAGAGLGICDRTAGVRDAIVSVAAGVSDCANVTATHLSEIDFLSIRAAVTTLKAGDFDGLTSLNYLRIAENDELAELPDDIFDPLSSLTHLELTGSAVAELPVGVFDSLASLTDLSLADNELVKLPTMFSMI